MLAFQKLVAADGYEVMLFPADRLYMTQDEGGDFSHRLTKNIDIVSWNPGTREYKKGPLYAPCTCKCVGIWDSGSNNRIFTSTRPVHTPTGLQVVTFAMAHDDAPLAKVGDTFQQGSLIAHTGTKGNVTGDHCHFNTSVGAYTGMQEHDYQGSIRYDLKNSKSVWDICYINDTIIIQDYDHDWQKWDGPTPPPPTPTKKSKRFPWVLYAEKLRS